MDPMHHHMHGCIKRASEEYKILEDEKAGKNIHATTIMEARAWPLLVAAKCEKEEEALREIEDKHEDARRFDSLLPVQRTLQVQNRLFKLLSRQGVRYTELLTRHKQCPFVLFLLLVDVVVALERLHGLCPEQLDEYSKGFLAYYGWDGISKPDALAELTIIAILVMLSTLPLENGNAGIRHALTVMSTHVRLPEVARVSADRLLAKVRSWSKHLKLPAGMRKPKEDKKQRLTAKRRRKEAKAKSEGSKPKPKRPGAGGAWRTFVSRKCSRQSKADFTELARLYRALPPDEKAELVKVIARLQSNNEKLQNRLHMLIGPCP